MKIVWKIFRNNIWNCILCFISSILVSAVLFLFEGIKVMMFDTMNDRERIQSSLGIAAQIYIYVLLFIGMILILYTVSHYSRARIRDYGMFMVLGGEKRKILQMIMMEYGMICSISYVIGSAAGTVFLYLIKRILIAERIPVKLNGGMFVEIIFTTFVYAFAIFVVAVTLNIVNLQRNSFSALLNFKAKKGRIPSFRFSVIGAVLGIACMAGAFLLISWYPMTYKKMRNGILLALCGLYLCFTCLGGLLLYILKSREKWYNRHLLKIKNLYYRFSESKNIILAIFVINLFVLVFISTNVVEYGNASSWNEWKYPFDYVWMTDADSVNRICQGVSEKDAETSIYPYIALSSRDGGEYIGISVSSYNQVAKKEEQLESGEILAILQKSEDDEEMMFQSDRVDLMEDGKAALFHIKRETKEVLFVAQQSEVIRILVMNDEDYRAIERCRGSDNVIITQNLIKHEEIPRDQSQMTAESCGAVLYSREDLILQDRQEDMMTLIFYICMGVFLLISNMTILAIKVWSEVPLLGEKYGFLKKLGMDEKDVKNYVKGELGLYLNIPFWLSVVFGIILLFYLFDGVEMIAVIQVVVLVLVLILLQVFYIIAIKNYGYHLVNKRVYNEGRESIWQ